MLLFYRRLVAGTYSKTFERLVWVAIFFIVAYTITFFVLVMITCVPTSAIWLRYSLGWTGTYYCAPQSSSVAVSQLSGALSVVTDFYSVVLPGMLITKIRISRRQKIGLLFIFGLGFL